MFRKIPKASMTIPAELHEKISKLYTPIDQVQSEILQVRVVRKSGLEKDAPKMHNSLKL